MRKKIESRTATPINSFQLYHFQSLSIQNREASYLLNHDLPFSLEYINNNYLNII